MPLVFLEIVVEILKLFNTEGRNAFSILENDLAIKIRREVDEDGVELAALNYCQIDSPKFHPIVREARGLIVCPNELSIVSRSFDRFFNHGEGGENEAFDINRACIMEKVDGSLMKLYFHKGKWRVSTRGTCFANTPVGTFDITFSDLFWRAAGVVDKHSKEEFLSNFHSNMTYIFELATPENRVVTRYASDQLVLLAARSPVSGYYKSIEYKEQLVKAVTEAGFNVRMPTMFAANDFSQVLEATKQLTNLQEGFVAWDLVSDERVKFKSAAYVAVHHIRGEGALVPKRVAALVLENEHEEYLTYFEEDRRFFEPYVEARDILASSMEETYESVKGIEDQREFALKVKDLPYSAVMFTARKKGISVHDAFNEMRDAQKISLLMEIKNENCKG